MTDAPRTRPWRRRRHRRAGRPGVDGGYSVVETAIAWPVFIAMILLVVQFALLWHARHVAEAAAGDGLDTARGLAATDAAGRDAATTYLREVAPTLLRDPQVEVTRTATTVRVEVRARVLRLVPGWDLSVTESATGPIERFVSLPPAPTPWPPRADVTRSGSQGGERL